MVSTERYILAVVVGLGVMAWGITSRMTDAINTHLKAAPVRHSAVKPGTHFEQ